MIQVDVMIKLGGRSYLTNVITSPNTPDEVIFRQAYEQVQKQWEK